MSSVMVVSRYEEDVGWLARVLENSIPERVEIYNKGRSELPDMGQRVSVRRVPNVGREGATFLDYIIENYRDLPDRIWFVQGDPFDHSPDFIGIVSAAGSYARRPFQSLSSMCASRGVPDRRKVALNDAFDIGGNKCSHYFINAMQVVGHCSFFDGGTALMLNQFEKKYGTRNSFEFLADRIGIARPRNITEFSYGACFHTLGTSLLRHPRWVYERAREFLLETDNQGGFQGFILERFWPYLVSGTSYETLTDCYRSAMQGRTVGVYRPDRKTAWVKKDGGRVIQSTGSTLILTDGTSAVKITDIDVFGPDVYHFSCGSVEEAVGGITSAKKGGVK